MANNNLQAALQMADNAARQVTGSYRTWTDFLATSGRLYKYPFQEQLLIYAQRPEATACAEWDFWNQRMRRYIRRGSKGIALIDNSRGRPVLRYVFDVADTVRRDETGLNPNLWKYEAEHQDVVTAALESRFDTPVVDGLSGQLERIAQKLAGEYWDEYQNDIIRTVDGSFLEGYDAISIGSSFRSAASASIAYTLMSRCGLDLENYFQYEDFLSVFDFNTQDTVTALGGAVSQCSEQVLRQIETVIKRYEREKSAERGMEHGEQSDLHPDGGLSDSQLGPAGAAEPGPGQIRADAPAVSEGAPARGVELHGDEGDAVQPPAGDRGRGEQPPGAADAPVGESGGSDGAAESHRSDGMGGPDEQLQGPGGGNDSVGADLQLSFMPPEIPTQQQQIEAIQEAESVKAPSAFSVSQADVDRQLRIYGGKMRIFGLYQQDLSTKERVAAIRQEYGTGGHSVSFSDGRGGFMDYRPSSGLEFWSKPTDKKFIVRWSEVEKRIHEMVTEGSYLSTAEMEKYRSDHLEQAPVEPEPASKPEATQPKPPVPARSPQEAIDAALQEWNGDITSKHSVVRYMKDHARDKGTAAWLKGEYGDNLPAFPVPAAGTDLPWPKVQRRIAQLIQKDQFYTQKERDNFDDIDPVAIREHLEQYRDRPSPFVERVMADVERIVAQEEQTQEPAAPKIREIYEKYKPMVKELVLADAAYQNACQNSDKDLALLEGGEAVKRAAISIKEPDFMRSYYDMPEFQKRLHREILDETYPILSPPQLEQTAPPDLSNKPITREGDTITIGDGPATHEVDITVSDKEWDTIQNVIGAADQPPHDPLAPAYAPGDTVYLNDTAFEIVGIGLFDVDLQDPALPIPLLRAESKENFERLLHRDPRNGRITSYLPADLNRVNDDFREVLTSHLLTDRDKDYISGWLRSGENNRGIAMRLSEAFASRAETVTLETGDIADYFTSTISMAVEIQDKFGTKLSLSWEAVAPILRAMYQQELDGFTHELVQREPVELEGQLHYQVGDKVAFAYGDHDVSGTIEYIGDLDIRIDTGPYAWSHQTVSRDFFEDAVRHDERNAGLFTPEVPEQEAPAAEPAPTPGPAAIYPADKNGLPYDVVFQPLRFDGPEQDSPEQAPAAGNFRITDDHLGEGGPKAKFRMNMEAINTLQGIELEGRAATAAEQEILSRYVGWGGLADAFDPDKPGWTNEFLELQAALTPEEYRSARASSLNAHYTSPTVIKAVYEALEAMGFQTGNILEPACGVGNFFGLLPESMAESRLYGVELDSISGRIAQQLYPDANIAVQGYEKTNFPRDFFDLAVGNVPFGQYPVNDREYNKLGFSIHNYFFAKTLDRVRPGGVVAFVTSRYTLDSKDSKVREHLAERADLLGAIRLPNNAFKANAGTEVVSDILFLQKRDTPAVDTPSWVHLSENKDGFTINRYFAEHPEMVLGVPTSESTQYGRQDYTVAPIPGADLAQQLHEAVSHIHGEYREAEPPELDADIGETEIIAIPADPSVKNYSYAVVDGEIYYRENSVMVQPHLTAAAKERVMSMVELRDCVRDLIDLQMDEFTPDSAIQEKQAELDRLYDAFSAKFGLVNDRANRLAFDRDSAYYLLCSLEVLDDDGRLKRKADMFTKRTIKQNTRVTSADTAMDALAVSIGERAKVDMPFMAQLTGKSEAELEQDLSGVIFRDIRCSENPNFIPKALLDIERFPLVTADEYLSGNVREKLRMAQAFHAALPPEQQERARVNVEALTAAQPRDLDASEIEVRLGTDWIDKFYIQQFMYRDLLRGGELWDTVRIAFRGAIQRLDFKPDWLEVGFNEL